MTVWTGPLTEPAVHYRRDYLSADSETILVNEASGISGPRSTALSPLHGIFLGPMAVSVRVAF